jgi:energy-coupling factor transport system ATP-binding protein
MPIARSAGFIGYVPQNVRDSFVATTVREELAFGLIAQGFSVGQADVRIREIVESLRLDALLERHVEELSAGEAVLVTLGAALVSRPTVLLLDEPFADLDSAQAEHVSALLARLTRTTQMCVVVAEHRTALLEPLATKRLHLPQQTAEVAFASALSTESSTGSITAIVGPNGCGKTTQLFARATAGGASVALVPETLSDFFVRDSVGSELSRSDHTARVAPGTTAHTFAALIPDAHSLAAIHPRDLSAGQQLALAIAIQIAGSPSELLIDEPTRGLDAGVRSELAGLLTQVSLHTRVTIATHDAEFVALLGAREEVVSA